jgi:sRNA-binding regulator protein Hfq
MSGNLVGSFVTMHIMSGTQMTGEVIEQNSESIFLEIDSEVYMVFKSKVCYVKMEKEKNIENAPSDGYAGAEKDEEFPQNRMTYDESYASLPIGLLNMDIAKEKDEDFSVFFGKNTDKISFSNTGEQDEKAGTDDKGRER